MSRIAIQGDPGCFSHAAARQLFGDDVGLLPCRTFPDAFAAVARGEVETAVIPVENSLAGPVVESLDLLWDSGLQVSAETQVRVELCLAARPGTPWEAIRRVASHPVALRQCRDLFERHPAWQEEVVYDTAGSVRELMEGVVDYDAAIGSVLAAELYGAEVLERGVEDNLKNYTRFFALGRAHGALRGTSTAMSLVVPNRPGGLCRALEVVANEGVDVTQIVARPIPGEPWHYRFHLELRGATHSDTTRVLDRLAGVVSEIRFFGLYDQVDADRQRPPNIS